MANYLPFGTHYDVILIAPVWKYCTELDAGPIRFVVESRMVTEELARAESADISANMDHIDDPDDQGASLHVYGIADGREHLRFDCFEREPHYHYLHADGEGMKVVSIDPHAEADPIALTLTRVRARLPEMLAYAGARELAELVRSEYPAVRTVIDRVEDLLGKAQLAVLDGRAASV